MILEKLKSMQTEYLKSKEMEKLGVLRYFISQIQNKEIELRPQKLEVTDEVVFKVLKKLIKNKNEAIDLCNKAGRAEAVNKESAELEVLESFVLLFPQELQSQL